MPGSGSYPETELPFQAGLNKTAFKHSMGPRSVHGMSCTSRVYNKLSYLGIHGLSCRYRDAHKIVFVFYHNAWDMAGQSCRIWHRARVVSLKRRGGTSPMTILGDLATQGQVLCPCRDGALLLCRAQEVNLFSAVHLGLATLAGI
jgi:hypothetical protein